MYMFKLRHEMRDGTGVRGMHAWDMEFFGTLGYTDGIERDTHGH